MKETNPAADPIGQNLIKLTSNVCFSVFVFSVLIFTVIAITYQPPDPWLESAPALTKLFTQTENATFKIDDTVAKTGEDLQTETARAVSPTADIKPITDEMIKKEEEEVSNMTLKSSGCEDLEVVNCSDPRVLITVEKFNLRLFKSIVFLDYQTPVHGSKQDECDVSWRFRNKKEKSWRKYRDFRRFKFAIGDNCSYKIVHAGGWHSGINARRMRIRVNSTRSGGKNPRVAPLVRDDEINDTIPSLGSETNFRKGKYLYYSRGGDYCKGMNQYMWSFLCGLGEAMYLNRTFVMDLSICLAGNYNPDGKDQEGKDFRFYFDFEHLKEEASIVEEGEFLRDWKKWDRSRKKKVPVKKVVTHKMTPMQLRKDKSTIIWRQFDGQEPENYWYRVCEGQAAKYIQRPWYALWKSKRLMNIVTDISGRMDWDFDAVHVIRGEKAQNKEFWPHLDADTSPDALVAKLQGMIQPWRNLYIATNERFYNYFDKLRSHFKVHTFKKACVAAYPSTLHHDIVWFWPNTDPQYKDIILKKQPPFIPELEDPSYTRTMGNRDIAYGYDVLVENLMDPAHVPYAHYGIMRTQTPKVKVDREGGRPVVLSVKKLDINGFDGDQEWGISKFIAPCIFYAYTKPSENQGNGDASPAGTGKPSVQRKMALIFICIPVSPGNSRLIWVFPRNFGVWIDKVVPRWIFHVGQNLILDSDLYLLHVEERKIMDVGPANWQKACFVPTKSDALVVGFRRWLNKYAGGEVDWKGKYSGALPPTPPREQLMDRYWSHVVNCRSCIAAHKGLNALEVVLQVASLALVGIVAATKQNVLSLAARNTMIAMAVLCFAGSKLLAHFIHKNFHYHDYNHAFR